MRDYNNVIAGGILVAVGAGAAIHAYTEYPVGTFSRAGPGLLPTILGVVLTGLGLAIAVLGFFRQRKAMNLNLRAVTAILAGILWFAFIIDPFGLVPAIAGLTVFSVLAEGRFSLRFTALLFVALSVLGILIFRVGLTFQLSLFKWPF